MRLPRVGGAGSGVSLESLAITPDAPSLTINGTQQFVVTGTYAVGDPVNLTSGVVWSSSDDVLAPITNGTNGGVLTVFASGDFTITATLGDVSIDTVVTVAPDSGIDQSTIIAPSFLYPVQAPRSLDLTVRGVLVADPAPTAGTLLALDGPSGRFRIYVDGTGLQFETRGNDPNTLNPYGLYGMEAGGEFEARAYYDAVDGIGDNRLGWRHNGCEIWPGPIVQSGHTVGPGIEDLTGLSVGSNFGADPWPAAVVAGPYTPHTHGPAAAEFILFGDSTMAHFASWKMVGSAIYTPDERWTRPGIMSMAITGAAISYEKTLWQDPLTDPFRGAANVKAFIYMMGMANIVTNGDSAATILADTQDLRDTVAADNPTAKHIIATMTPARGVFDAGKYATWQAVNAGIPGLTGFDAVVTSHTAAIGDGNDYLAVPYNWGDGLHENNAARDIVAAAFRSALVGLGLL